MTANILRLILLRLLALYCGFCLGVSADMLRVYVLADESLGTNYQLSQLRPDLANWWHGPPHVIRVGVTPPPTDKIWQVEYCLPNPLFLQVELDADERLTINRNDFGTTADIGKLRTKLSEIFQERLKAKIYRREFELFDYQGVYSPRKYNAQLTEFDRVERTVFLYADRRLSYGVVAKVVDALNSAGASPVILQLEEKLPPPWIEPAPQEAIRACSKVLALSHSH